MEYDPTAEALMRQVLEALDAQEEDAALSYIDVARRVQAVLITRLGNAGAPLDPEGEVATRHLVGYLDPHADDAQQDGATLLRRLQTAIDRELSRWTSAILQPPGPSGGTAVAAPAPPPEEA